eukprot:TRINITY_DN30656_c0_g1_i1.p1 TRINITY_DN30656_c0_g1~~TRINITY_DN30656_c0_g1_i1.p1  ORF type:complete len:528 (-),score=112.47 TRINITY_DN30656_c0_g1_i1:79-1641(-)
MVCSRRRPWLAARRAALAIAAAPVLGDVSEAPYVVQRHGQDTTVRRADGSLLFTTAVEDTSAGTDTDADLVGDEEFFHGCLWTFRQKLEICEGGSCGEAELLAHDLQRRLRDFYADRARGDRGHGRSVAPPVEPASWLVLGTRQENRAELAESCPGLVVTSLLLIAEALTFSFGGGSLPASFAREAESYAMALQQARPADYETMLEMFPVQEAYQGQALARESAERQRASGVAPSVDVVVSRCSSSLQWLWEYDYPPNSRVLVYEKCAKAADAASAAAFAEQVAGLQGVVASVERRFVAEAEAVDAEGKGLMTGECTAYLAHIVSAMRENTLADYTIFVHDDGPRHLRLSLLGLVLRGLRSGQRDIGFLHLAHERYPAFRTPCLKEVYRRMFNTELSGSLSTYCCSHFVVSRDRIETRSLEFYERLTRLINTAPYAKMHGGGCNIGRKPCYVMEFLWHHVFGEPEELPARSEDATLPLGLRYDGGRETRLPSPLSVGPYMALFRPARYSSMLEGAGAAVS